MKENSDEHFKELYEKYAKEVESFSGGLVATNKSEFLKFYVFIRL
jgi:hypothetical protein